MSDKKELQMCLITWRSYNYNVHVYPLLTPISHCITAYSITYIAIEVTCIQYMYIMVYDFELFTMYMYTVPLQLQHTISCEMEELTELVNRRRQEQSEGPQIELEKEVDACAKVLY